MPRAAAIAACLKSRWLSEQPKQFQNALTSLTVLKMLEKGEQLFHVDDEAKELFFLAQGTLIGSLPHPLHGSVVGQVVLPGSWFGEAALLGRKRRALSVVARQSSKLLAITKGSIEKILREKPDYCWSFFNLAALNSKENLTRGVDLLIHQPKLRMASRLLGLSGHFSSHHPISPLRIPISHEELAIASNLSRQSVHTYLTELEDLRICRLRYREIEIVNVEALSEIVFSATNLEIASPLRKRH